MFLLHICRCLIVVEKCDVIKKQDEGVYEPRKRGKSAFHERVEENISHGSCGFVPCFWQNSEGRGFSFFQENREYQINSPDRTGLFSVCAIKSKEVLCKQIASGKYL